MEKIMSVLLMLVILGTFITSSQAITCHSCSSNDSPNCGDPFISSSQTCSGNLCFTVKGQSNSNGLLTIYLLSFSYAPHY